MNDTRERLMNCFRAVFPTLSEAEIARATHASVGEWDSVATVTLMGVVEEEFGVSIDPEQAEDFVSFDLILDHLSTNGK